MNKRAKETGTGHGTCKANKPKHDQQVRTGLVERRGRFVGCTCDDMMARAPLSFPFPANGRGRIECRGGGDCTSSASVDVPVCIWCMHVCVYACVYVVLSDCYMYALRGSMSSRSPSLASLQRGPMREEEMPPSTTAASSGHQVRSSQLLRVGSQSSPERAPKHPSLFQSVGKHSLPLLPIHCHLPPGMRRALSAPSVCARAPARASITPIHLSRPD